MGKEARSGGIGAYRIRMAAVIGTRLVALDIANQVKTIQIIDNLGSGVWCGAWFSGQVLIGRLSISVFGRDAAPLRIRSIVYGIYIAATGNDDIVTVTKS